MKKNFLSKAFTTVFLGAMIIGVAVPTSIALPVKSEAASSNYSHNHTGYKCTKITTYMPANKVKQIANQANQITNAANWASALGGGYKGWIGSLTFVYGQSVSAQMTPFKNAAKKNKGVEYTYVSHSSLYTSDVYMTNRTFVAK